MGHHKDPFYGKEVIRREEKKYIEDILAKYRNQPATEALKQQIFEELQMEKHHGRILIPFKVVLAQDPTGSVPDYVEVLLDTKV